MFVVNSSGDPPPIYIISAVDEFRGKYASVQVEQLPFRFVSGFEILWVATM